MPISVKVLSAVAALAMLAGCSNGAAILPTSTMMQSHRPLATSGRVPTLVNPVEMLKLRAFLAPNHQASFNVCPASGPLVYMSDGLNGNINIYKVPFSGQGPCGQLTAASGLSLPFGLIVRHSDLFVADLGARHVVAFHRGATKPYITYTDQSCGGEFPFDVAVSKDDYVFATNFDGGSCPIGSLSIWQKQSSVLVGTIPNQAGANPFFLTIQKDGTLYYDDKTGLYSGSCPGGSCGAFTNTGASFGYPGGLRSADGEDVVLDDQTAGSLYIYEPPHFDRPVVCQLGAFDPVSFDINLRQHHVFVASSQLNQALEFSYPDCKLIGTVPGNIGGSPVGIAKDFPETL
jgi:hypothetical protein